MLFRTMILGLCVSSAAFALPSKNLGAIWFIGDSITQGNADGDKEGSPRKSLYDLLKAGGYTFSFTGHHTGNVDGLPATGKTETANLYHYHSGVSGIMIGEPGGKGFRGILKACWNKGRLKTVKPNIILIMLGTNDVGQNFKLDEAPDRLRALLDEIYALPDVGKPKVFLASIPPNRRNTKKAGWAIAFNKSVPMIVADYRAKGRDIHFVDQFTPLNKDLKGNMKDSLHPNRTGNAIMAKQWFEAIKAAR